MASMSVQANSLATAEIIAATAATDPEAAAELAATIVQNNPNAAAAVAVLSRH